MSKKLSNPYSTGSGGSLFENNIQTAFAVLMLTDGFSPCLPQWTITKIKLQGKHAGFETDDLIVFVEDGTGRQAKLLAQVKHTLSITENDPTFQEVIEAAWNDFNNPKVFTFGQDSIALITGPLATVDINDTRVLFEWARNMENAEEFLENVAKANFSNATKRNKLKAFRKQLKKANNEVDVSDEKLWEFLKSFYLLGYDLDIQSGVHLSLLHSLIDKDAPGKAKSFWAQVKEELQYSNQAAGTVTKDYFSNDIHELLRKKQAVKNIPVTLLPTNVGTVQKYHSEFITALLIGQWHDTNDNDRTIIEKLSKMDYDSWIAKIRLLHSQPNNPMKLKNGTWNVEERLKLLSDFGNAIYDEHIDLFVQCAVEVLKEKDPQFKLEPKDRFAASVYGEKLAYSHSIRKGLVEILAMMGNNKELFPNCSQFKIENAVSRVIDEILSGTDWVLLASLNHHLPLLSEASPDTFLKQIEESLLVEKCPFDELFAQEGDGITGENYLTGILWALEGLAWEEEYLGRVSLILSDLALRDPGGQWSNRPINSLTTIFLPWMPQTLASIEKRKSAIIALQHDNPDIAWNLVYSLLPSQHQISSGSHKPQWRTSIPEDAEEVSQSEYWEQVNYYASITVDMVTKEFNYLLKLTEDIDHLPNESFNKLIKYLDSLEVDLVSPEGSYSLWLKLVEVVRKHRYYSEQDWAMDPALVDEIDRVSSKFSPKDLMLKHKELFSNSDHDFYSDESYEDQSKQLNEKRVLALTEIYSLESFEGIMKFAQTVESPFNVGFSLASLSFSSEDEQNIFLMLIDEDEIPSQFAKGFVSGNYHSKGWPWVDIIEMSDWTSEQKASFFMCLPFEIKTWQKVDTILGEEEKLYWEQVYVKPWESEDDRAYSIEKLLIYNRPEKALECIFREKNSDEFDTKQALNILFDLLSQERLNNSDFYKVVKIITKLQNDPNTDQDALFQIEWNYLPLLGRSSRGGSSPKLLQSRLSTDPEFFSEVIQKVYKSTHENKEEMEPTEDQKNIASNAYDLLSKWKRVPGVIDDGTFDPNLFKHWISEVKKITKESGHFDIALIKIGNVLIYAPEDPNGLWIHSTIVEELNSKNMGSMREGYHTGILNSRGVHIIDPTGAPEKELAEKYIQQAEIVEGVGYMRFGTVLRELAKDYTHQAEQIIQRHSDED